MFFFGCFLGSPICVALFLMSTAGQQTDNQSEMCYDCILKQHNDYADGWHKGYDLAQRVYATPQPAPVAVEDILRLHGSEGDDLPRATDERFEIIDTVLQKLRGMSKEQAKELLTRLGAKSKAPDNGWLKRLIKRVDSLSDDELMQDLRESGYTFEECKATEATKEMRCPKCGHWQDAHWAGAGFWWVNPKCEKCGYLALCESECDMRDKVRATEAEQMLSAQGRGRR
jgi:hypothetical protein